MLSPDVTEALDRIADPTAAATLRTALDRLTRATDAMTWARDRLPALVAASGEPALLDAMVGEAALVTEAPEVWALTWTGPATRPTFRALAGRGASAHAARTTDGALTPESLSRSILGRVVRAARPEWTDDAVADARYTGAESVHALQLRSVGCVPIGTRGALYLSDERPNRFGPEVRARLAALCALAAALLADPERPRRTAPAAPPLPGLVGASPAMLELAESVHAYARMPWPVLVLGETGTGKEAIAKALHTLSPRAAAPFVIVDGGTLDSELARSELFGHEKNAFTGATHRTDGALAAVGEGTVFLDEVGELPAEVQKALLRLAQSGTYERVGGKGVLLPFRGRIVAATHRAIGNTASGFREDLYHRLSSCVIHVPPLRDRPGDVPLLAEALLRRSLAEVPGAPPLGFEPAALAALAARAWPGNVRDLQNAVRGAVALALASRAERIGVRHLGGSRSSVPPAVEETRLEPATDAFQRKFVEAALQACGGSKAEAADRLGVSRQWLYKLMARWED